MAWTYGGWRREATQTAQRDMLVLHLEEVEAVIGTYQSQGALNQNAARFQLLEYRAALQKQLDAYNDALGLTVGSEEDNPFVEMRPR